MSGPASQGWGQQVFLDHFTWNVRRLETFSSRSSRKIVGLSNIAENYVGAFCLFARSSEVVEQYMQVLYINFLLRLPASNSQIQISKSIFEKNGIMLTEMREVWNNAIAVKLEPQRQKDLNGMINGRCHLVFINIVHTL